MSTLGEQKCLNHRNREAVARCPHCEHFFCRECITEHKSQVICARCMSEQFSEYEKSTRSFNLLRPVLIVGTFSLVWMVFFMLGRSLLILPDSFHEQSIWQHSSVFDFEDGETEEDDTEQETP